MVGTGQVRAPGRTSHLPDGGPSGAPYLGCGGTSWPILDHLATRPQLDLGLSVETEARLQEIAGGLSVALGRVFRIIDPKVKNPQSEQWGRCLRVFDELL